VDAVIRRGTTALYTIGLVVYGLDRLTKALAEDRLSDGPVDVVPGLLTLRLATNSGGAFSVGRSAPWFFAAATIVVSLLIVATSLRHRPMPAALALGAILGGALGNLTDRITRGSGLTGQVVDFIDVHVWPVFNLADSGIVLGALGLAWLSVRQGRSRDSGRDDE
jgi:signal peptidase II